MGQTQNQQVAAKLQQAADLLEQQGANPFRVNAYRRAADTVAKLPGDVHELLDRQGLTALIALPNIGKGIAAAIWELVATGRWSQLDRLRGTLDPIHLFRTVPGIGPRLARQIHEALQIDNLEALETAAYDGRLEALPGFGTRRLAALRAALSAMLGRTRAQRTTNEIATPPVGLLLEIDQQYRKQAVSGQLPRIAPKRFNPERKAWLPVLHNNRSGWHFTLLFSNTARAHELDKTQDWVIAYFYDDHHQEVQHTIVTETRGPLVGKRVIRGREIECLGYYAEREEAG